MIMRRIQDGKRRSYLYIDRSQNWVCIKLDYQGNVPDKFLKNLNSGLKGDVIIRNCL